MQLSAKKKPIKLIETVFDVSYLGTVLLSAVLLCSGAKAGSERWQFGLMALILGVGDAFHLLPRIHALWDNTRNDHTAALGMGKLIASLTMTVFYVLLWNIGVNHYAGMFAVHLTPAIYALAVLRIALCLLPQNHWTAGDPPLKWAVWRNIPFFLLGMCVMSLFAVGALRQGGGLSYLWLAVLISFACYLPVALFSGRSPKLGMLMLPKSDAYAAIVLMGFSLPGA